MESQAAKIDNQQTSAPRSYHLPPQNNFVLTPLYDPLQHHPGLVHIFNFSYATLQNLTTFAHVAVSLLSGEIQNLMYSFDKGIMWILL